MVAEVVDYVVGVDTHRDEHTLALVEAATGTVLAQRAVASTGRGYAQALRFAQQHADAARVWAVEGAGHYGAGLARFRRPANVPNQRMRPAVDRPAPHHRRQ